MRIIIPAVSSSSTIIKAYLEKVHACDWKCERLPLAAVMVCVCVNVAVAVTAEWWAHMQPMDGSRVIGLLTDLTAHTTGLPLNASAAMAGCNKCVRISLTFWPKGDGQNSAFKYNLTVKSEIFWVVFSRPWSWWADVASQISADYRLSDNQLSGSRGEFMLKLKKRKEFFSAGLATLLTAIRASGVNHVSSFSQMDLGIFGGRKRRTVCS